MLTEIGTRRRLLECTERTPRVLTEQTMVGADGAWEVTRENNLAALTLETDPIDLQSNVRRLSRVGADFLPTHPPSDIDTWRLQCALDAFEARWSMRKHKQLRAAWKREFPSRSKKAHFLIDEVERIGVEPHHAPASHVENEDIHRVCWTTLATRGADCRTVTTHARRAPTCSFCRFVR